MTDEKQRPIERKEPDRRSEEQPPQPQPAPHNWPPSGIPKDLDPIKKSDN